MGFFVENAEPVMSTQFVMESNVCWLGAIIIIITTII